MEVTPDALGRDKFREACLKFGLPINSTGYGFLQVVAADGRERTRVTRDVAYHRMLIEGIDETEVVDGFHVPRHVYLLYRWGWPGRRGRQPTRTHGGTSSINRAAGCG